jgi:D-3-phosphoglycerate dehydrogenase
MKILFADKFPTPRQEILTQHGHELSYQPDLGADDLANNIGDAEVLVVRSTRVSKACIDAATKLKLIIRAGAGTNTIDKKAANAAGKHVCNCPGTNSAAVAELAMGLMLATDRRIPQATAALKRGEWNKKEFSKADGIKGKTMGIVGMGAIGKELAQRAHAFDMTVLGYDVVPFSAVGVEVVADLDELLTRADVISLHVPLNDATQHLIDARRMALMKPNAILINTSRGGIIDEKALVEAVKANSLRVAVDVFETEPAEGTGAYSGELGTLDAVIGTHHIGASTEQAQLAVADEVIAIVDAYAANGSIRNEVKA